MAAWIHWQAYLLDPLLDAVLARRPDDRVLLAHGRRFPDATDAARRAAERAESMGFAPGGDWQDRYLRCGALERQDNLARLLGRSLTSTDCLEIQGAWPAGAFMALGLHWGNGFPALEHLQLSGRSPAFVYQAEDPEGLPSWPARLADRLHLRALASFGPAIRVGGAYQAICAALAAGRVPVVLIDALPRPGSRLLTVDPSPAMDRVVHLRRGVLGLLAEQRLPFVFFRCWQPGQTARRRLEISPPACFDQPEPIAECAAEFLLESLHLDSSQWHFWPQAEALLDPPKRPPPGLLPSLEGVS